MVNAHAVDLAFPQEAQNAPVGGRKHLRLFHAQRGQVIDIEEPPVVDLFRRHAPVTQAIRLRLEQGVQQVNTVRVVRGPVEQCHILLDECLHRRVTRR